MRFREFAPRKRNRDQQVDEVLPAVIGAVGGALGRGALAAGGALARGATAAGGALARGAASLGGAALRGAGNLATQGVKTLGQAAGQVASKALFTPQGMQRQTGAQPGAQTGQQTPPVQIKPGVKILHPGIGAVKIKNVQGKDAVLDTQKELGQDVRVDQNELLAVLGQGQQAPK